MSVMFVTFTGQMFAIAQAFKMESARNGEL
jgi:hypothetical protein